MVINVELIIPDNYYVNIPATYVSRVNNPSKKLLDFKKQVAIYDSWWPTSVVNGL